LPITNIFLIFILNKKVEIMINSGREWDWIDNIKPEKKLKKASKRFA